MKFLGSDLTNDADVSAFGGGSENALETNPAAPLQGWRPILFNPTTGKAENPDNIQLDTAILDYDFASEMSPPPGWDNDGLSYGASGATYPVAQSSEVATFSRLVFDLDWTRNFSKVEFGLKLRIPDLVTSVDGAVAVMGLLATFDGPPFVFASIEVVVSSGIARFNASIDPLAEITTGVSTGLFGPNLEADVTYDVRCRAIFGATAAIAISVNGVWSGDATLAIPAYPVPGFFAIGNLYSTFITADPESIGTPVFNVIVPEADIHSFDSAVLEYPSTSVSHGRQTYVAGLLSSVGVPNHTFDADLVLTEGLEVYYEVTPELGETIFLPTFFFEGGVTEEANVYPDGQFKNGHIIHFVTDVDYDNDAALSWRFFGVDIGPSQWAKFEYVEEEYGSGFSLIASGSLKPGNYLSADSTELQVVSSGFINSVYDISGYTTDSILAIDPGAHSNYKIVNSGNVSLSLSHIWDSTLGFGSCYIDVINDLTAGTITLIGFDKVIGGDLLTTTNGDKFRISVTAGPAGDLAIVVAMQ